MADCTAVRRAKTSNGFSKYDVAPSRRHSARVDSPSRAESTNTGSVAVRRSWRSWRRSSRPSPSGRTRSRRTRPTSARASTAGTSARRPTLTRFHCWSASVAVSSSTMSGSSSTRSTVCGAGSSGALTRSRISRSRAPARANPSSGASSTWRAASVISGNPYIPPEPRSVCARRRISARVPSGSSGSRARAAVRASSRARSRAR